MSVETTKQYSKIDLPTGFSLPGTYRQVDTDEGNKITLRIPSNANYGSGVFSNLIHFTITLKLQER